jgi:hypothetical protein
VGVQEQLTEIEETLTLLQEKRDAIRQDVEDGLSRGGQLREAARKIGESSSGSWVGWHSRMYYRDFREPPVAETWDTEWGGIHGVSDAWKEKSLPEIQGAVEGLAATTLADLAATADRVRETCQPIQQELLTVLTPICDLAGFQREAEMLGEMESIDWIVSPSNLVQAMAPQHMMSRDSVALHQGLQAPLHLNVEAAVVSNTGTLATSRDFLDSATRLARQIRTKLAARSNDQVDGGVLQAVADPDTAKQLRRRSFALFVLLTLATAGGVFVGLRRVDNHVLIAAILVAGVLFIAGVFALLINRGHAIRALAIAGGVVGAVAAVEQLLEVLSG